MSVPECLLKRMQLTICLSKTFHGRDRLSVRLAGKHQARANRYPLNQHRAGTANTVLAADVRAGQAKIVTQEIGEVAARLDRPLILTAIHTD